MYTIDLGQIETMEQKQDFIENSTTHTFFHVPRNFINQADSWQLRGTNFDDDGEDYTELQLLKDNEVIWGDRSKGY